MKASHTLQGSRVAFDDPRLVGNAELLLHATLGQQLGLEQLVDEHVDLGAVPGAANPGAKALTVIASLLAGGDCIDHVNALRAGRSAAVLGHRGLRLRRWSRSCAASHGAMHASSTWSAVNS